MVGIIYIIADTLRTVPKNTGIEIGWVENPRKDSISGICENTVKGARHLKKLVAQ